MSSSATQVKNGMNPRGVKHWLGYGAAFVLGAAAVFAWQTLPVLSARLGGEPALGVVVPAVTETTYTFDRLRGFDALLTSSEGKRLEFPRMWLPGDARPGARFRVTTDVSPSDLESRFAVMIVPDVAP